MSKELKYNLYSPGDCLSGQQLFDYIGQRLSPKEEHIVEKHLLDCELCSDALEGLRMVKDRERIGVINQLVKERIAAPQKKIIPFNYRTVASIAAGLLLLIGSVVVFKQFSPDSAEKNVALTEQQTQHENLKLLDSVSAMPPAPAGEEIQTIEAEAKQLSQGTGWSTLDSTILSERSNMYSSSVEDNAANEAPVSVPAEAEAAKNLEYKKNKSADKSDDDKDANTFAWSNSKPDKAVAKKPEEEKKEALTDKEIAVYSKKEIAQDEKNKESDELFKTRKKAEQVPAAATYEGVVRLQEKQIQPIADSTIVLSNISSSPTNAPYLIVEVMPEFPGGESALSDFIKKNFKYPADSSQVSNFRGAIFIEFIVGQDGRIREPKVVHRRTTDASYFEKEALRVVSIMPDWIAGKENGKAVSVKQTVPFKIEWR